MDSLRVILGCLESSIPEGRPRFHDPSARSLNYDPEGSSIFIVDYSTFLSMHPSQIQKVFRHRHVLVSNVPTEKMEFDLEGLSSIGSLSKPISIQGNMNPTTSSWFILLSFISVGAKKGDRNPDNLIQTGTLRDLYTSAQDHDNPLILNALDCPMGNASIPPPPSFTYV
jgi:hypothetical protein